MSEEDVFARLNACETRMRKAFWKKRQTETPDSIVQIPGLD